MYAEDRQGAEAVASDTVEWADRLLDQVDAMFTDQRPAGEAMSLLGGGLRLIRSFASPPEWEWIREAALRHPVKNHVLQDPFTAWSYEKPRGYAGDATLIDFIYRDGAAPAAVDSATPLGKAVYEFSSRTNAPLAVIERRDMIADLIDTAAARVDKPSIFTIAGGHLREADKSAAFQAGKVGRWVYLDQDEFSAAHVERRLGDRVEVIEGSVRGLLAGKTPDGEFDLIYATGLYDYLADRTARRLTEKACEMLKPGGSYVCANFATHIFDRGYMESFMDWSLVLRTEAELLALGDDLSADGALKAETLKSANGEIIYLKVTRVT